jgi:penicillin G amidase
LKAKTFEEVEEFTKTQQMGASNNWAIHGNHTKSGKPILSGDPHLGNMIPSIWLPMSLVYKNETGGVETLSGAFLPGFPCPSFGKTSHLAFAMTVAPIDDADLYEEIIVGDTYLFNGTYHNLTYRNETIKVKGEEPVTITIRHTHHGPILDHYSSIMNRILYSSAPIDPNGTLSIQWTGDKLYSNGCESFIKSRVFCHSVECALNVTRHQ